MESAEERFTGELHDALVELTGAHAGFLLALQNMRRIALAGLITGIVAAISKWQDSAWVLRL